MIVKFNGNTYKVENVFFISDTHFGHNNVIPYCDRPFQDAHEMNGILIANWNRHVGQNDLVFHLGDFSLNQKITPAILQMLNGKIVFIKGNHDQALKKSKVEMIDLLEIEIQQNQDSDPNYFVLCHYPMLSWNRAYHGAIHLFGHVHGKLNDFVAEKLPESKMLDVGVDSVASMFGKTPDQYRPLSIGEVLAMMDGKKGLM